MSSVFLFQMHLLSVLRPLGEQVGELIPIKVECQIALTYYIYSPPSNLYISEHCMAAVVFSSLVGDHSVFSISPFKINAPNMEPSLAVPSPCSRDRPPRTGLGAPHLFGNKGVGQHVKVLPICLKYRPPLGRGGAVCSKLR